MFVEVVVFPVQIGHSSCLGCQPARGEAGFLAGHGAEPSSSIALDFLTAMVLQSGFCTAEHKVIFALGSKGYVLTFFRTE